MKSPAPTISRLERREHLVAVHVRVRAVPDTREQRLPVGRWLALAGRPARGVDRAARAAAGQQRKAELGDIGARDRARRAREQRVVDAEHDLALAAGRVEEAARVDDREVKAAVEEVALGAALPEEDLAVANGVEEVVGLGASYNFG